MRGWHHAATVGPEKRAIPVGVVENAETQETEAVDSFRTTCDVLSIAAVARH